MDTGCPPTLSALGCDGNEIITRLGGRHISHHIKQNKHFTWFLPPSSARDDRLIHQCPQTSSLKWDQQPGSCNVKIYVILATGFQPVKETIISSFFTKISDLLHVATSVVNLLLLIFQLIVHLMIWYDTEQTDGWWLMATLKLILQITIRNWGYETSFGHQPILEFLSASNIQT